MNKTSTLIVHGQIIDGSGSPAFHADILLEGERIKTIGTLEGMSADRVVDASGCLVTPGFIDTHSHSDLAILKNPLLEPKIRQGITTEILGQDGISIAPVPEHFKPDWEKNLSGLAGSFADFDWNFTETRSYLKRLELEGININAAYLVPHGNIRLEVMGYENRPATPDEIEQMKDILRREMAAGAIGLSSGLIYVPCVFSTNDELLELCREVAALDGIFVVHQRSEANQILSSMTEMLDIARQTGVALHFSHFKICGRRNFSKLDSIYSLLDIAASQGLRVSFDQYPYFAGSTMLSVIIPGWAHAGGTSRLLENLRKPETRERIRRDILEKSSNWDNFVEFAGLDGILVTSVQSERNRSAIGKNLVELGEMRGCDPLDATFDLLIEENNSVGMVNFYGSEAIVRSMMLRPEQNFCTDGILSGLPHPRAYGAYVRVLDHYVIQENLLPMEAAIHKMTGKPASTFKLQDRGYIRENHFADIVIFRPETLSDVSTFLDPCQHPQGIEKVFVNGSLVFNGLSNLNPKSGHVVRSQMWIH